MKSKLLIMAALCAIAFTANAQTKGTNTLGFGLGFSKQEINQNNGTGSSYQSKTKNSSVSIGYGFFFKDNEKVSVDLSYGSYISENASMTSQTINNYGGSLSYQKYYPIVKKFYAYAGGNAGYSFSTQKPTPKNNPSDFSQRAYNLGAFGGLSWFLSKRFALETNLLSANLGYSKIRQTNGQLPGYIQEMESSSFGISTGGVFNNLGFKIYLLF